MRSIENWDGGEEGAGDEPDEELDDVEEISGVFPSKEISGVYPVQQMIDTEAAEREVEEQIALERHETQRRLRMLSERPRTRGDCKDGVRPCPWFSCRHHLGLDIHEPNDPEKIKLRFLVDLDSEAGESEFMSMSTCALDIADQDGATLEEVAQALGVTREGARLLERGAYGSMKASDRALLQSFHLDHVPSK